MIFFFLDRMYFTGGYGYQNVLAFPSMLRSLILVLMTALVQQKKIVLGLVKQMQNFAKVYIIILMRVACI